MSNNNKKSVSELKSDKELDGVPAEIKISWTNQMIEIERNINIIAEIIIIWELLYVNS